MTIKNIEYLKKAQTICRNQNQVKDCLNYLKQLGFDVEDFTDYYDGCNIVFWGKYSEKFVFSNILKGNLPIEFYNKKFIKILKKLINEKEEQKREKKEEVKDFKVASDGRIIAINNKESKKEVFICSSGEAERIRILEPTWLDYVVKQGLTYATQEAMDKAIFKMEIETKLKNIAERLNNGRKIDWNNDMQGKIYIYYNYPQKLLDYDSTFYGKHQGIIYCLHKNFLNVAKKEIGEENLIKYFKGE